MNAARKVLTTTVAATACAACLASQSASAATLNGTVVGRPTTAAKNVVVPVLLSSSGERTAGAAVARVVVPSAGGIRTVNARIKPADLRVGDRVSATVARITTRPRSTILRVTRRAATPSFARMDSQRSTVTAGVTRALDATKRLTTDPMSVLDPANPAADNQALRDQLRAVRTDLNFLIADLRATADSLDATVALITAARPADPARLAVVTRRQAATLDTLTADATAGRDAAKALDDAVANLDETINAVGEPSAHPLPIETVTAASNILYAVLDLLRGPGA
ncbi:MAG: hypothetical protein JWM93_2123 [Frankiales bacterium]|nr:hypothetical protein [Frankiales bacterium]MCW3017245.1 hypothetical protein [Solirubrobacterales bacterium]